MEPRAVPPTTIGRFRIEALLGSGGMGSVYRAVDPTLKRTVAVKTVRADIHDAAYLNRLFKEAQACARLQHPHIVTVYEAGEIDGVVYIAMELLKGQDLSAAIAGGQLTLADRLRAIGQILDALQHAHGEGVIHRDIKPSNVFLLPDGTVKLVDFGLAHMQVTETVTASAAVMGTPHYASPEQLRGEVVDARTDIYSTGALAYEMLTGRRPFQGDNDSVGAVVLRVMSAPLPPMGVRWSRRFPELERIVARALAKNPADRFQSAAEMRQALASFVSGAGAALAEESEPATPSAATMISPMPDVTYASVNASASDATGESAPAARRWWMAGLAAAVVVGAVGYGLRPAPAPGAAPASSAAEPSPVAGVPVAPAVPNPAPEGSPMTAGPSDTARPPAAPPGRSEVATQRPAPDPKRSTAGSATPLVVPAPSAPRLELSARDVFAGGGAVGGVVNTGLRFRLVQRSPSDAEMDVDPASTIFHSGDRVRFAFESNIDGHLYVVQQGSSGRWTVLFPNPDINGGRNAIRRGEEYLIPNDDWFLFDATPGTEQVFVFLSREPLTQLPGFDRPVTKLESLRASVVDDLRNSVQSRDLILEKTASRSPAGRATQPIYVVNREAVGKSVAHTIVLTHAQ